MAISVPLTIGTNSEAFAASTITLTTTATVPPGAKVWCFVGWSFSTATLTSGSDNAANPLTWRVDRQVANGSTAMGLMEADAPKGLPSGTVITATFSDATPDTRMIGGAYSTGVTPGPSFNGRTDTSGTTGWTSGSRTVESGELMIGGCCHTAATATSTPTGGNTEIHDFGIATFSALTSVWRIGGGASVANTGTWTAGTINASLCSMWRPAPDGWAPAQSLMMGMRRLWRAGRFQAFPLPAIDFPSGGGVTYQPTGSLVAGTQAYGGDFPEYGEAGSLTPFALMSGADVFEHVEAGSLTPDTNLSGADATTFVEAGSLMTQAIFAGTGSKAAEKAGSLIAGVLFSGADASTFAETGSLTPDTTFSGADVFEHNETGSLIAGVLMSGADVFEHIESGALVAGTTLSGVSVKITSGLYTKTGALLAGTLVSGGDAHTAVRLGSLTPSTALSGGRTVILTRTGSLLSRAFLAGVGAKVGAIVPNVAGAVTIVETAPQGSVLLDLPGVIVVTQDASGNVLVVVDTTRSSSSGSDAAGGAQVVTSET